MHGHSLSFYGKDQERYRFILDAMQEYYFETDLQGTFTFCNKSLCELLNISSTNTPKNKITDFMPANETARYQSHCQMVCQNSSTASQIELTIVRNGEHTYLALSLYVMRNTQGVPIGVRGIARNTTKEVNLAMQLAQSEESRHALIETAPYAISISKRSDSKYVEVNNIFCHSSGYDKTEVIGKNAAELNFFKNKADCERYVERFNRDGFVDAMEIPIIKKTGDTLDALVSARPIRYDGEDCMLSAAMDISELNKAQKALIEKEESHRTILEIAPYSIAILRYPDFRFALVNDFFCHRSGYSREETIGQTTAELGLYADMDIRAPLVKALREGEHIDNLEVSFKSKGGLIRHTLISARPIRFKNKSCILVVAADISELKEAQKALNEREQKYRNILMNMEEGYWEVNLKGTFTSINEAEARLHRCTPRQLIGKNNRTFSTPETAKKVYQIFNRVYKTGVPAKVINYEMIREDGSPCVIESSVSLLKDADDIPIGFFGISRDITEKKRVEQELEKYRQHLEEMVQARTKALQAAQNELLKRERLSVLGQLTATVSHELRNPLGVIRSSNYYLQRKVPITNDKIEKHFRRIEEQVTLCDTIVADLLEYTRGKTASMVTAHIKPWLEELLNQAQEMGSIQLRRKMANDLPPVAHDPEKMRRVLVNLIDNAFQAVKEKAALCQKKAEPYTPEVCIVTRQKDNLILIEVQDNGVGMDEETCNQAFEPFFTNRARGTGIGLANVMKIIKEHSGDVSIESKAGAGTILTIELPCVSV